MYAYTIHPRNELVYKMPLTKVGKWTVLYGIVVAEVAALTGAYYVWHNMNTDQS